MIRLVLSSEFAMEFLTIKETAKLLRVSPITIRRYIASGQLAAERVGRGIRVRREAIEEFVTPVESSQARRRTDADHPATILEGLGISAGIFRSGEPTNIAEFKHEYLTEAYEDLHDEDDSMCVEPRGKPFSKNDPEVGFFGPGEANDLNDLDNDEELPTFREQLGNIIGIGRSGHPVDVSANKYEYLADAYESDRG
jgi:excisionase family DNA binding protein